jgi:hypothetical protein
MKEKEIIVLNQAQYINKLLTHFGMEDCKGASTPIPLGIKLQRLHDDNWNHSMP